MRQSKLFTKTIKQVSAEETSINSQLLLRGGFIERTMAGVYSFLPLGLRVLNKIKTIVREEMDAVGGQEILMSALTPKEIWETTGRYDKFEALFKFEGNGGKQYVLGATHEEVVTPLVKKFVNSYKDLPVAVYQIQDKFRNEPRAKSGLLRGREFSMKDMYSFHINQEDLDRYYEIVKETYFKIFQRAGIGERTFLTFATGGVFSKYSHEFQMLADSGEDTIYLCLKCHTGLNAELLESEGKKCPECGCTDLKEEHAIEVGNIFKLGTKFSKPFDLCYTDKDGARQEVIMGCYGMGPSRLMGAIVEAMHDEHGIIWPESLAPFRVHLVNLAKDSAPAEKLYQELLDLKVEVLYDDREESAGIKLKDADLLGLPWRLVLSDKLGDKVELKSRAGEKVEILTVKEVVKRM